MSAPGKITDYPKKSEKKSYFDTRFDDLVYKVNDNHLKLMYIIEHLRILDKRVVVIRDKVTE